MFIVWQLLILLVIVAIVYVYTFRSVQNFILNDVETIEKANAFDTPLFNFSYQRNRAVNCELNRLPCVTDQQCRDNCVIASAASQLSCREGFCNAFGNSIVSDDDENDDNAATINCDPALGLMRVYSAGGDFVVAQTCVSTYRDIVDDTGTPRPYVCDNGRLDLNLNTVQFSLQSCECASGYVKMAFRQTALARTIPICIPARVANLYRRIYSQQ
ncbi:pif3 [Catopsilia pomona nucleopolyhedrovirus]|uniref:Pif3 n=1 Tax=Catopsilia pomona nucleopolyhedrovirus TaxID=1850906 RepID=A0A172WZA7_9ABAC|nr:pif3 [Catopsilia pomona nucleopolyhedrovirus]ANF29681.1 pif3 [Catopsilia pomona nucleopolyhedrovirus]